MIRKNSQFTLFFLLIYFACNNLSCIQNESLNTSSKIDSITKAYQRDQFFSEIPMTEFGTYSYEYATVDRFSKLFDFVNIQSGVDSLEARIYFSYDLDSFQVVKIGFEKTKWIGSLHMYKDIISEERDSVLSTSMSSRYLFPVSGWSGFIDSLVILDFFTLPNCSEIENYSFATNGQSVLVEITGKHFYRIYSYFDPSMQDNNIKEAEKIKRIMAFLQRQLGFTMYKEI